MKNYQPYYYWLHIFLLICFLTFGCVTTDEDGAIIEDTKEETSETKIKRLIKLMQISKGGDFVRLCQEIISYKEEALPYLITSIDSVEAIVRIGSMYCVTQIYINTKSDQAKEAIPIIAKRLRDRSLRVKIEAAASLCEMGDYQGVSFLIEALSHENPHVRQQAHQTLSNVFRKTLGYHHLAAPAVRNKQAKAWANWWNSEKNKYLKTSS